MYLHIGRTQVHAHVRQCHNIHFFGYRIFSYLVFVRKLWFMVRYFVNEEACFFKTNDFLENKFIRLHIICTIYNTSVDIYIYCILYYLRI